MPRKKKSEFDLALMTPGQVKETEVEIKHLENMLKVDQSGAYGSAKIQDLGEFRAEIKEKKDMIAGFKAKKMRGPKANKAFAYAKTLAEKIKKEMPSFEDYHRSYPSGKSKSTAEFDFEKAVRQQTAFQQNAPLQGMIREYKNIMGRLDPDDPTVRNIELLRS